MTATTIALLVAIGALTLVTAGALVLCYRLQAMVTRLARESARMRRRAIRAEARVLRLTTAVEAYVDLFAVAAAELGIVGK